MDRSTDGTCGKQTGYAGVKSSESMSSTVCPGSPVGGFVHLFCLDFSIIGRLYSRGVWEGQINLYLQETTYVCTR